MNMKNMVNKWRMRCSRCGRFIGNNDDDAVTFTKYGRADDMEPPDAEFECGSCVRSWTKWDLDYMKNGVWIPARKIKIP
jgi:hypothetical protein